MLAHNVPHKQNIHLIEKWLACLLMYSQLQAIRPANKQKTKTINTIIKQVDAMITITSIMVTQSTDLHDTAFDVEYEVKLKEAYHLVIESLIEAKVFAPQKLLPRSQYQNELRCEKGHFIFQKKTKKLIRKIGRLKSNITLFQKNLERYFTADFWDIEMYKDAEAGLLDKMAETALLDFKNKKYVAL
jgi:hypothetical protein